jgi:hypothetical protein
MDTLVEASPPRKNIGLWCIWCYFPDAYKRPCLTVRPFVKTKFSEIGCGGMKKIASLDASAGGQMVLLTSKVRGVVKKCMSCLD